MLLRPRARERPSADTGGDTRFAGSRRRGKPSKTAAQKSSAGRRFRPIRSAGAAVIVRRPCRRYRTGVSYPAVESREGSRLPDRAGLRGMRDDGSELLEAVALFLAVGGLTLAPSLGR